LDFKLIITIEDSQHKNAKIFLENIKQLGLENTIINLGPIEMKNVPSLYKQCDGLLMPTLLESFSGTYVEAMYHQLPIFTSGIDFASGVCNDSAFYFDPFDEVDILSKLLLDKEAQEKKVAEGIKVLNELLNWNEAFIKYNNLMEK